MLILKYMRSVNTHPTAEEVYKNVSKQLPRITRATVYRNLHSLANQGLICRFEVNREYRFDATCENHPHLINTNTGEIMDIDDKAMMEYVMSRGKRKGFKPTHAHVVIYGTRGAPDV